MAIQNNTTNSRLLMSTSVLREKLNSRNLYTPNVEYPLTNDNNVSKTVSAINTIIGGLTPFKSYNLENTVYGRLLINETPLATIGLAMLGKQMALNTMSSIAQENFPKMNIANLFDKDSSTKLFTKQIDYSVTVKSGGTAFGNFLRSAIYWYPQKNNPFNPTSINSDYIQQTGIGQLKSLYSLVNKNIYKPQLSENDIFYTYADKAGVTILPRISIINNRKYFEHIKYAPYSPFNNVSDISISTADYDMIYSVNSFYASEYAPNKSYITDYFGTSFLNKNNSQLNTNTNSWIDDETPFRNENLNSKIVWGRDGIIPEVNKSSSELRGLDSETSSNFQIQDLETDFNVKTGLLEYTRNLINATEGRIGDLTRKAFVNNDKEPIGFNGSALWNAPANSLPSFAGKTGVRQHSVLDPYNRFAKAIRFDGNNIYAGNPDSVIYNSVIPRIHPTINDNGNGINNKNLMFSIENLAVNVISRDGYGIIDDEYGSQIPLEEVGPFNGRIMWFPPYAIDINETANAKFEPTVMVGRNEPMYNYMNSERSATLSFSLLIDYPPQVKNLTSQKEIAEFFAYGTIFNDEKKYVSNLQIKMSSLQEQIDLISERNLVIYKQIETPKPYSIYFPNDSPKVGEESTIIDKMYKDYAYEITSQVFSKIDNNSYGYNKPIYFISGLTSYDYSGRTMYQFASTPSYSQYSATGLTDQFGIVELNKMLKDVFENEDNRKYYDIVIQGGSTKLYTEGNPNDVQAEVEYNEKLGQRRANAAKILISKRLEAMFGKPISQLGINISSISSVGSSQASQENATAAAISNPSAKQERYATIKIVRNSTPYELKTGKLTTDEQATVDKLKTEIEAIKTQLSLLQNNSSTMMKERREDNTAILNGFKSIKDNYFYPAFHSQTPEDFHKRLTFLQQCTRQGSAKRYDVKPDANGILRARNSVFGRQPICILRIGDFIYSKVIIESVNFDYSETTWDMNPEGFGMQPMMAKITLTMKILGGQSLKGPVDALQNAVSFNYYANSTYTDKGMYLLPSAMAALNDSYRNGIDTANKSSVSNIDIIGKFITRNINNKE